MGRDKGTGTIYQRQDDQRWVASIMVNGQRKTKTSQDKAEVKRWLKEQVGDAHRGTLTAGKTPTVAEYFREWIDGHSVAPQTRVSYERSYQRIVPYGGHIRLDRLNENQLKAMWRGLGEGKGPDGGPRRSLASTTLQTVATHLNTALKDAVRSPSTALRINPMAYAKPGRGQRKELHPLTEEEVHQLFTATADDPLYPVWLTLITTGLRLGEVIGLKLDDVDLDGGTLTVRRGVYRLPSKGIVEGSTKTGKGRRVDLPATTVQVMRDYLLTRKVRKVGNGLVWDERGYFFCSDKGGPLDPVTLNHRWHAALDAAGLKQRKLHETRHTYATLLFAKGEHPKVVQEQMGHSTIAITLDTYSAYIPTMGRSAADRMETLFA